MLVVSRKQGESLLIGDDIEIFFLEVEGLCVKVGIKAPKNIKVLRRELIKEVEAENLDSINHFEDLLKKIK